MAKWGEIKCPRCAELDSVADALWNHYKDRWRGEKKFALREIVKHLRGEEDRAEREVSIE